MTVYDMVKTYREEHGMSLRTFAKVCGLSHQTVANIEAGINPRTGEPLIPSTANLQRIAAGMGMTLQDLLMACDDFEVELPTSDYRGGNPLIGEIVENLSGMSAKQIEDVAAYVEFVRSRG